MADYRKMYNILCNAANEAVTTLEKILGTQACIEKLVAALREAEEVYIETEGEEGDP